MRRQQHVGDRKRLVNDGKVTQDLVDLEQEMGIQEADRGQLKVFDKLDKLFKDVSSQELGAILAWIQCRMVSSGASENDTEANMVILQCIYDPVETGNVLAQMCHTCVQTEACIDFEDAVTTMIAVLLASSGVPVFDRLNQVLAIKEKSENKRCGIIIKRAE